MNRYSTPAYLQGNGQGKTINKVIVNGLKKSLDLIEERREKAMIIHPSSLHIIQPFFQPIDYDLINSLDLSISLGVGRSGILICNSQVTTVSPKGLAIKLKAVI